jgi:hypothetical protein
MLTLSNCLFVCSEVPKAVSKAAVYQHVNGNWAPTQDGGLSNVGLYENTATGTSRIVAISVSNPSFVRASIG